MRGSCRPVFPYVGLRVSALCHDGGLAPRRVYVISLFVYTWPTLPDFGIDKSVACVCPGPLGIHDSSVCVYLIDSGIRNSSVCVYLTDLCIPNFALSGICRHQTSLVPAGTFWRDRNNPRVRYTQLAEVYTTGTFVYTKRGRAVRAASERSLAFQRWVQFGASPRQGGPLAGIRV